MSTEWGLDLDMSAVRLMQRTGDAWDVLQTEAIDSPDIEERLNTMLARIDNGAAVTLFLPRDQILCTEIDVASGPHTKAEIEAAMDGRTPYALDELILDWEVTSPNRAMVAVIARDTLDEAAAFAEVRGIGVAEYSSLGLGDQFPRLPRFNGPLVPSTTSHDAAAETVAAPATPELTPDPQIEEAMFATARKPSRPPVDTKTDRTPEVSPSGETLILKSEPGASLEVSKDPVVQVDDATPVMLVKGPALPLNPGAPVAGRIARPRVRTDIAAGAVSGRVDSLSPKIKPGGSVQVHRRRNPLATTALVFAAAFVLTIGIATLVWSLLPFSPDPDALPAQAETGLAESAPERDLATAPEALPETLPEVLPSEADAANRTDIAALSTEVDEPVVVDEDVLADAETPTVPDVPELPQPIVFDNVSEIFAPKEIEQVNLAAAQDKAPESLLTSIASMTIAPDLPPAYDATPPPPASPEALATILKISPRIAKAPDAAERLDDINVASIESSNLASDAIALPSVFSLQAENLPVIAPAPAAPAEAEPLATAPASVPTLPQSTGTDDAPAVALTEAESPFSDTPEVAALTPAPTPALQNQTEVDGALAAAVTQALTDALAGPGGLIQTEHAAALTETAPQPRPQAFVETIERDQFGGRTRAELASFRPPARPASDQQSQPAAPPSTLAVARSLAPRLRPDDFGARVAAARVQRDAERLSASVNTRTPDTSSAVQAALATEPQQPTRDARQPNIPTSASVARQATVDDAIRLNKVNLVGVYGIASDRRALVRLPSGRYVKVKVGDRVDGGTVAQITDRELIYRKGSRTLSLAIPQG